MDSQYETNLRCATQGTTSEQAMATVEDQLDIIDIIKETVLIC